MAFRCLCRSGQEGWTTGDLNLGNVLTCDGGITGIVDCDHLGVGSRALTLTSVLFDWQPVRLADETSVPPDGGSG